MRKMRVMKLHELEIGAEFKMAHGAFRNDVIFRNEGSIGDGKFSIKHCGFFQVVKEDVEIVEIKKCEICGN